MSLRTVIDWVSVTERPPVEGWPCLLVANGHVLCGVGWWDGEWFRDEPFGGGRELRRDIDHYCHALGLVAVESAGEDAT